MLYFFKIEKDTWKNQNFEKMKKLLDISFYTCVPKTKIIWGSAVSEIEWDRQIFCTFALFFALLPQKIKAYDDVIILYMCTKKSPSYGVWLLRYGCNHTIFCHFGSFFALLLHYWPQILKIEIKRRYFLFHMCTINKDYRDIRHNRLKFLSFWTIFCPFFPLTNQNIKILKKWKKKTLEIFYICLPRMTIIWCTVPEIWSSTGKIFSHFGLFFALLLPGDIISLHLCTTNDKHMMYGSLDIRCNVQRFLWTIFCPFDPCSRLKH